MKHLIKSTIILSFMFVRVNYSYALDIQQGEWMVKSETGITHICITPELVSSYKNTVKGTVTKVNHKNDAKRASMGDYTSIIMENTSDHRIEDITFNKPDSSNHVVIDLAKMSDTQLQLTITSESKSAEKTTHENHQGIETFVSSTCSEKTRLK